VNEEVLREGRRREKKLKEERKKRRVNRRLGISMGRKKGAANNSIH
jgi:hypothetical protein